MMTQNSNAQNSPILITGTGAMASLFAGQLASAGNEVIMLGTWQKAIDQINQHGLLLEQQGQIKQINSVRATSDPAEVRNVRLALVLGKAWQTQRIADQLALCLPKDGLALSLQNGLGNREILTASLGVERVGVGVTTLGATLLGPGRVRQAGEGSVMLEDDLNLASFSARLRHSGFFVETTPDLAGLQWGKLVINAAINPLTALLGVANGELLVHNQVRRMLEKLAREAAQVASLQGIRLPYPDPVTAVEAVAERTAQNLSSMLQDVRRGAPTEVDQISGAVVRVGERLGVPTPLNRLVWQLVKTLNPEKRLVSV